MSTVAAIVPTIPGREELFARAMRSIQRQTRPVDYVRSVLDSQRLGAWKMRNFLVDLADLAGTDADFIAFLDDDDEWLPDHIEVLLSRAETTAADLVYSCWESDVPAPVQCGPWDPVRIMSANWIPVTHLVRTSAFRRVGGFPQPGTPDWPLPDAEDWGLLQRLAQAGAVVEYVPEVTWRWNCGGDGHTRGVA